MKRDEKNKLHQQTVQELENQVRELEINVSKAISELRVNKLKNTKQPNHLKHKITIIKTIIRQKQLETAKETK